MARRKMMMRG
uniref:Uncharacterized protein n=1 Tax=Arundo donax TaxID=35708 RepID=A0A0A9DZZ0_ARUDO